MYEQAVGLAFFDAHLPCSFKEWLALDVPYGSSDLRDYDIAVTLCADAVYEFLDLVGDVRDDLDCTAEVFPFALLVQHVPVHLTGGEV